MPAYFVVDHVSDQTKVDGLVESYQMIPVKYEQDDGSIVSGLRRLNFVHWPSQPHPFVHEEWSEDLVFSNIYTPEDDNNYDDEEEDEDDDDYTGDETSSFDGEELEDTIEAET
jgi:hypothetical protein